MKKNMILICSVLVMFLLSDIASSQTDTAQLNKQVRPFQVTLVPPIGTNGIYSKDFVNDVSINVFLGVNGGVNEFEIGGFGNINHGSVNGGQFAGFGNINSGDMTGAQLSGFFNINGGTASGLQGAGFFNINENSEKISQLAGFFNVSGSFTGIQASGFGNVAENFEGAQATGFINVGANIQGLQGAGFLNVADSIQGAQVAGFLNVADDVEGLQASGFLNVADNVKGLQLAGFLNICDSIDGIPVAFLSIVHKNGYRRVRVSSNEVYFVNLAYKIGVQQFYTIFNAGIRPGENNYLWSYGVGFGTNFTIDENKSLDLEAMHVKAVKKQFWDDWENDNNYYYNNLNKLDINFNYHLANRTTFYAGPSFNILVTEESVATILAPKWAFNIRNRYNSRIQGWFGFNAGIQF